MQRSATVNFMPDQVFSSYEVNSLQASAVLTQFLAASSDAIFQLDQHAIFQELNTSNISQVNTEKSVMVCFGMVSYREYLLSYFFL